MMDVVQVPCPHCRNALRMPLAWTEQPMRCKFCQQVFQARRRPASPSGPPEPRAARGSFPWQAIVVAGAVFTGVGVAAIVIVVFLGSSLQQMFVSVGPPATSSAPMQTTAISTAPKPTPAPEPTRSQKPPETTHQPPVSSRKAPVETAKKPPVSDKKPPESAKKPADTAKKPPDTAPVPTLDPTLRQILDEIALFPAATGGRLQRPNPADLPAFPAPLLETYASGYNNIIEFRNRPAEFPVRAGIAKTIATLTENDQGFKKRLVLEGKFFLDPKQLGNLKNQVKNEQDNVAQRALILKELVRELVEVGEKYRDGEIKRCQVLFDYTMLKLKARVVHIYEYNYTLALVRSDSLAPLEDGNKLYRLTGQEKVTINEGTIKQYVKDLKKGWPDLAKNFPDSPWAAIVPREQALELGLAWQPAKK